MQQFCAWSVRDAGLKHRHNSYAAVVMGIPAEVLQLALTKLFNKCMQSFAHSQALSQQSGPNLDVEPVVLLLLLRPEVIQGTAGPHAPAGLYVTVLPFIPTPLCICFLLGLQAFIQ